jgi:hypothetical protein
VRRRRPHDFAVRLSTQRLWLPSVTPHFRSVSCVNVGPWLVDHAPRSALAVTRGEPLPVTHVITRPACPWRRGCPSGSPRATAPVASAGNARRRRCLRLSGGRSRARDRRLMRPSRTHRTRPVFMYFESNVVLPTPIRASTPSGPNSRSIFIWSLRTLPRTHWRPSSEKIRAHTARSRAMNSRKRCANARRF